MASAKCNFLNSTQKQLVKFRSFIALNGSYISLKFADFGVLGNSSTVWDV